MKALCPECQSLISIIPESFGRARCPGCNVQLVDPGIERQASGTDDSRIGPQVSGYTKSDSGVGWNDLRVTGPGAVALIIVIILGFMWLVFTLRLGSQVEHKPETDSRITTTQKPVTTTTRPPWIEISSKKVSDIKLHCRITTGFPPGTVLHVSVGREYYEVGSTDEYLGELFSRKLSAKEPAAEDDCASILELDIIVDDTLWIAERAAKKDRLKEIGAGKEIHKALPSITVSALFTPKNPQPVETEAVAGKNGEKLSGVGVKTIGAFKILRVEKMVPFPSANSKVSEAIENWRDPTRYLKKLLAGRSKNIQKLKQIRREIRANEGYSAFMKNGKRMFEAIAGLLPQDHKTRIALAEKVLAVSHLRVTRDGFADKYFPKIHECHVAVKDVLVAQIEQQENRLPRISGNLSKDFRKALEGLKTLKKLLLAYEPVREGSQSLTEIAEYIRELKIRTEAINKALKANNQRQRETLNKLEGKK